jgi:hypothetical protein
LPPISAFATLLGLPRFSPARLALAFALLIVATGLAIAAFVELVEALRLALLTVLHPAWVSLIVGAVILGIAGVLCMVAYRLSRPLPPPPRPERPRGEGGDPLAQALGWVRRHPQQATVMAAVLGFVTGAVPEAREALKDILKTPP